MGKIQEEWTRAEKTFYAAANALPDTAEGKKKGEKLWQELKTTQDSLRMKALELAEADPESNEAWNALEWLMGSVQTYNSAVGPTVMELITQHHADNPKIGEIIALLGYYFPHPGANSYGPAFELLKAVKEKNPDRTARGQAALGLAWRSKHKLEWADPENVTEVKQLSAEAIEAFELVLQEFGDCANLRKQGVRPPAATLGEEAKPVLFELQHLQVGKPAPEIVGEDLNGASFRLSDAKGKVVLLVFWASWCGPCMAAVPHEKELVERFKGRPFTLIGVNGDGDTRSAKYAVEKNGIPWRSFWNGPKGGGGPIAMAWNVRGWPTVYVIDHKGVIRHTALHGNSLDAPLETLVAEAEKP